MTLSDSPAVCLVYTCTIDGVTIRTLQLFAIQNGKALIVTAITDGDTLDEAVTDFESIIHNLELR